LFFSFANAYASYEGMSEQSDVMISQGDDVESSSMLTEVEQGATEQDAAKQDIPEQDNEAEASLPSPESDAKELSDDDGIDVTLPSPEPEPESELISDNTIIDTLKDAVNMIVEAIADGLGIDMELLSTGIAPMSIGSVPYIALDGTTQYASAILIDGSLPSTLGVAGTTSWYAVDSNASSNQRVAIYGNVNLILEDTHLLTANAGIDVSPGSRLTIWAQVGGTGGLNATGSAQNAGIGGTNGTAGTIIINGGQITATGGNNGAGIGGGANSDGGTIIINAGTVSATGGGWGAAGIGGGSANPGGISGGGRSGAGGSITINGGTVTATGNSSTQSGLYNWNVGGGAGIGGAGANNSNITLEGATTSNGISSGAGGTITINGGKVIATGGDGMAYYGCGGAGIGSGGAGGYVLVGNDGTIMIASGATITAKGGAGSSSDPGMAGAKIGFGGGYSPPNSYPGDNIPTTSNIVISPDAPLVGTPLSGTYTYVPGVNGSGVQDNQNLSATVYQWYRSNAGITDSSFAPIAGATGSTYTPTGADVGQYLYLMVTVVNTNGIMGMPVLSNSGGQVGLMVSLVVNSGDSNDEVTIQDMNADTNPNNNVLTATNGHSQSIIIFEANAMAPALTAIPDTSASENILWTISPVNGGAFKDTGASLSTSAATNPIYQLPIIDANLTQPIVINVTFTPLQTLDAPTGVTFNADGSISFTSSANNVATEVNATYEYTLYQNGNPIMTNPIDISNTNNPNGDPNGDGSATYTYTVDASSLISKMLTSAGSYFVVITITPDPANSAYLQQPVTSVPAMFSYSVYEVNVTTIGMIGTESISVSVSNPVISQTINANTVTTLYVFQGAQIVLNASHGTSRIVTWIGAGSDLTLDMHRLSSGNVIATFSTLLSAPAVDSFDQSGNIVFTPSAVNAPASSTMTYTYTLYQDGNPVLEYTNKPITNYTSDGSGNITYNADQDGIVAQMLLSPGTYTVTVTARTNDPTYSPTNVATSQMSTGVVIVAPEPEPKVDATISPNTAIFDIFTGSADYHKNIDISLTPGSYALVSISLNGTDLQPQQDYTISGTTITLLASYLNTINIGQNIFTLNMDGGTYPTLTVNVINTEVALEIIDSDHAVFTGTEIVYWKINAPLHSFFRMTLIDDITHAASVVDQSDFTITEGSTIITMSQDYVKALPNGEYHFRAEFVDGHADLYLTVSRDSQQGGGPNDKEPGNGGRQDDTGPGSGGGNANKQGSSGNSQDSSQQNKIPQTGIDSSAGLLIALLVLALFGTFGTIIIIHRINRKDMLVKINNKNKKK